MDVKPERTKVMVAVVVVKQRSWSAAALRVCGSEDSAIGTW